MIKLLEFVFVGIQFSVVLDLGLESFVVLIVDTSEGCLMVWVIGRMVPVDDFLIGLGFQVEKLSFVG